MENIKDEAEHEGTSDCSEFVRCCCRKSVQESGMPFCFDPTRFAQIVELSLFNASMCRPCVTEFANELAHNNSIRILDLSNNLLGSQGGIIVAEALRINSTLQVLRLTSCGLTADTLPRFGQALAMNQTLQSLTLDGNTNIGPSLGALIRESAKNASSVFRELSVSSCAILSEHCADLFAATSIQTSSLCSLSLQENPDIVSDNSVLALRHLLCTTQRISYLCLDLLGLSSDQVAWVKDGLSKNRSLQTICFSAVHKHDFRLIQDAITENCTLQDLTAWASTTSPLYLSSTNYNFLNMNIILGEMRLKTQELEKMSKQLQTLRAICHKQGLPVSPLGRFCIEDLNSLIIKTDLTSSLQEWPAERVALHHKYLRQRIMLENRVISILKHTPLISPFLVSSSIDFKCAARR